MLGKMPDVQEVKGGPEIGHNFLEGRSTPIILAPGRQEQMELARATEGDPVSKIN